MSNKSRKNRRKRHQVYEGIRCASALTFISGYVNAFTFVTQGRRFAGVQTGNVLYFAIRIAEKTICKPLISCYLFSFSCLGKVSLILFIDGPTNTTCIGTSFQAVCLRLLQFLPA